MRRSIDDGDVTVSAFGSFRVDDGSASGVVSNIVVLEVSPPPNVSVCELIVTTNAVLTAGRACRLTNDAATPAYINFSVEL